MPFSIDKPIKLKLIAAWFIWEGVSAIIDVALALDEKILINFSVCQLFVGLGLLKLNPRSHDWAMFWVKWDIAWGLISITLVFFFAEPVAHEYKIFEVTVGYVTPYLVIALSSLITGFLWWQYTVLNSRRIRLLFGRNK